MRRAWSQAAVTAVAVLFFRTPGRASPAANPRAMPSLAPLGSGSDRTQPACGPRTCRSIPPPTTTTTTTTTTYPSRPRPIPRPSTPSPCLPLEVSQIVLNCFQSDRPPRTSSPFISRQPPVVSGIRDITMSNPRRDTSHSKFPGPPTPTLTPMPPPCPSPPFPHRAPSFHSPAFSSPVHLQPRGSLPSCDPHGGPPS